MTKFHKNEPIWGWTDEGFIPKYEGEPWRDRDQFVFPEATPYIRLIDEKSQDSRYEVWSVRAETVPFALHKSLACGSDLGYELKQVLAGEKTIIIWDRGADWEVDEELFVDQHEPTPTPTPKRVLP